MSTDDCTEIGSGKCPCGNGLITVERCSPDHAWGGRSWLVAALSCSTCSQTYSIYNSHQDAPKLVLRSEINAQESHQKAWHAKIKEIESTAGYKNLRAILGAELAEHKSAAARYRVLSSIGLTSGSLATYRKNSSYWFSGVQAERVMKHFGFQDAALESLIAALGHIWEQSRIEPKAIPTGVNGLQA